MNANTPMLRESTTAFTFGEQWCAVSDTCIVPARCCPVQSPSDRYYTQTDDQRKMTNGLARFLKLKLYPHLTNFDIVSTGITIRQKQPDSGERHICLGFPLRSQLKAPLPITRRLTEAELECLAACYQAYMVGNYAAAKGHWLRFCDVSACIEHNGCISAKLSCIIKRE